MLAISNFTKEMLATTKKNERKTIIEKYKDDKCVIAFLKFMLDFHVTTGISDRKLAKYKHDERRPDLFWKDGDNGAYVIEHEEMAIEYMDYLKEHNTGTKEDVIYAWYFINEMDEYRDLAIGIVTKNYPFGADVKTVNEVLGEGTIPSFSVQLAHKYFDSPEYVEGKEFSITQKVDGHRCVAIKEHGRVQIFARSGNLYEGLDEIEQDLLNSPCDNFVIDGEVVVDNVEDSLDGFKTTQSVVSAKGKKTGVVLMAFDCISADRFNAHKETEDYSCRRFQLESLVEGMEHVRVLPILYTGKDTSVIIPMLNEALDKKWEGLMININSASYAYDRTKDLLKVKVMQRDEFEIVGMEEGDNKNKGKLGAFIIKLDEKNTFKLGGGFSDEQRQEFYDNFDRYIGKMATVQFFEMTTNKQGGKSLRFPVFVSIRDSWDM